MISASSSIYSSPLSFKFIIISCSSLSIIVFSATPVIASYVFFVFFLNLFFYLFSFFFFFFFFNFLCCCNFAIRSSSCFIQYSANNNGLENSFKQSLPAISFNNCTLGTSLALSLNSFTFNGLVLGSKNACDIGCVLLHLFARFC